METLDKLLEKIDALSAEDRLRLLDELRARLEIKEGADTTPATRGLELFLSLAGTAHSDHNGVSADKYPHLTDAYSDEH